MKYHWSELARAWNQVGSPLRPTREDLNFVKQECDKWRSQNSSPRILILGVTPELYNLNWPEDIDIYAVDHTQGMIDAIWPGLKSEVTLGEWTDLPLPANSRDIVLCDGGLHLLSYPKDQKKLVTSLTKVVCSGGIVVFRLFVPPETREFSERVLSDLLSRNISSLNILKLRLGMSLQESATEGIELGKVWKIINSITGDLKTLAEKVEWPIEHLLAINSYKTSKNRYHFVTVDDVIEMFTQDSAGFELLTIHWATYELSDRCPTVVFRKL